MKYLTLALVTIRALDDQQFLGEGFVAVLTDGDKFEAIEAAAVAELDSQNPVVRHMQVLHGVQIKAGPVEIREDGEAHEELVNRLELFMEQCPDDAGDEILEQFVLDMYTRIAEDTNAGGMGGQLDFLVCQKDAMEVAQELADRINDLED